MFFKKLKKFQILLLACLLVLIDAIGIGLVLPIMPQLFYSNMGFVASVPSGTIHFFYGLTIAIFPLLAMIGMPILGFLSDKFNRKIVMLWGIIGLMGGYLISIVALVSHNVFIFLLARMISGFSSGTYSVCYAAVMDVCDNESQKVEWLKYLTLSHVVGFILGPALSSFVHDEKNSLWILIMPFLMASIISFINFLLVTFIYPNARAVEKKSEYMKTNLRSAISALIFIFKQKLGGFLYGYMLFNLGLQVYIQAQSVHLMKLYHYTASQIGVFYITVGIAATMSMFVLHPRIRSRISAAVQVKIGMLLMGSLLLLYTLLMIGVNISLAHQIVCTWIVSILIYIVNPFVSLNMTSMFSDWVAKDIQGSLMGALGQIESLTTVVGTLLMALFLYFNSNIGAGFSGVVLLMGFVVICFSSRIRLE